ncbi:nucleotidyltransferase domain-containing protein [Streptomyces synnematoformans]|uniref:Nucleotidyltransferase n=1 Tax=Streptomyces synnematoformans TaxID=415721 RepID=A0ABN2XC72_9ACTN
MNGRMLVLLSGIVGSTAYGLAHAGSDVDRLGVYAEPTERILGLRPPGESLVTTKPDVTMHEAAKFCRLTLRCNPSVTETLWLDGYEVCTPLGEELIGIRSAFLSAARVRNAYLGYATSQFKKLRDRGDGTFSADLRKRTEKHARHLVRLIQQGEELHATGALTIRLAEPDRVRDMGAWIADQPDRALVLISRSESRFDKPGVLPAVPDEPAVEAWLQRVRAAHYTPPKGTD